MKPNGKVVDRWQSKVPAYFKVNKHKEGVRKATKAKRTVLLTFFVAVRLCLSGLKQDSR